jgi:hypothetical protein
MQSRYVTVAISARKEPNYPTIEVAIGFSSVEELLLKIDDEIAQSRYRKVDVRVMDEKHLTSEERLFLEDNDIEIF